MKNIIIGDVLPKNMVNVLYHISPVEHVDLLSKLKRCLSVGARLVVFEHNPFNALTRRVKLNKCSFDRNVELLTPAVLIGCARDDGFDEATIRCVFCLPWEICILLGTQYMAIAHCYQEKGDGWHAS